MAHIVLWEHPNFDYSGDREDFRGESRNLHNNGWGDKMSGFEILSGFWRFFEHVEFGGLRTAIFGPGRYADCRDYGIPDDFVSSMQYMGAKLYVAGKQVKPKKPKMLPRTAPKSKSKARAGAGSKKR